MSCIYKIICKDTAIKDFYIGSTNNLKIRKAKHKYCITHINNKSHYRVYSFINENGGWFNFKFEIIIQFKNILITQDLRALEGAFIKLLKPTLNTQIAGRSVKQYYKDNRDTIINYKRTKIVCNCCQMLIRRDNIARHKRTFRCKSFQNTNQNPIQIQQI